MGKSILIVIDYFPKIAGGAERQVYSLVKFLRENKLAQADILVLQSECLIKRELEGMGVNVFVENLKRVYDYDGRKTARKWMSKIKGNGYSVVMSYHFGADLWIGLFLSGFLRKHGVKVISNRRDSGFWMKPAHRLAYKYFLNGRFDLCVYVSGSASDAWPGRCAEQVVIPNGMDVEGFRDSIRDVDCAKLRHEIGVGADDIMLLYTASLFPLKNHGLIIRAVEQLKKGGLNIKAVFAGYDRGGLNSLKGLAKGLSVSDNIVFLGAREDVPALVKCADICAQVSFSEGMSNTLIEYMAGGKTVIASDIGPNREVAEGVAIFVSPYDVNGFCRSIKRIVEDKEYAGELGDLAFAKAEDEFSIEKMAQRYLSIF